MRITESRLRRVIQQVIRESMDSDMSQMSPMAPSALEGAIKEFASSASNDDLMQLDKDGYIDSNCCERIASSLKKETGSILGEDQIVSSCVFPVLINHIDKVYPDKLKVDLEYVKFRDHLLMNTNSIVQEMMNVCR